MKIGIICTRTNESNVLKCVKNSIKNVKENHVDCNIMLQTATGNLLNFVHYK